MRYHINSHGEVAVCNAGIRRCPLRGVHFKSREEAEQYADKIAVVDTYIVDYSHKGNHGLFSPKPIYLGKCVIDSEYDRDIYGFERSEYSMVDEYPNDYDVAQFEADFFEECSELRRELLHKRLSEVVGEGVHVEIDVRPVYVGDEHCNCYPEVLLTIDFSETNITTTKAKKCNKIIKEAFSKYE